MLLGCTFPPLTSLVRRYQIPLDLPPGGARIRAEDLFGMLSSNWAPGEKPEGKPFTLFAICCFTTRCCQTFHADPFRLVIIKVEALETCWRNDVIKRKITRQAETGLLQVPHASVSGAGASRRVQIWCPNVPLS